MASVPYRPNFAEPVLPDVSVSQQPLATAAVSMSMLQLPKQNP